MRAVGIDLGATDVWAVRSDGLRVTAVRGFTSDELAELRRWCGDAVVAIDAPAAHAEGLPHAHATDRFRRARCSEFALAAAGYYVREITPSDEGSCPAWMQTGFAVWRALAHLPCREVYPDSVFRCLNGRAGPVPGKKTTLRGRRVRLALLRGAGLRLPDGADAWNHDAVDAAAACLVAADPGARELRCEQHPGSTAMWLPAACV